jgi:hypothetical protein
MQIVIHTPDSLKEYISAFSGALGEAPRNCPRCGGRLKGHGRRYRWIVSLEGLRRVPIQRMICKACHRTVSLLPRMLHAFFSCTRAITEKIKSLWIRGVRKMAAVRNTLIAGSSSPALPLSTLYRWAGHTS